MQRIRGPLLAIASTTAVLFSACQETREEPDVVTESTSDRLARVIREYDAQGIHRTGTDVDQASGRWLADEVRRAGVEPKLEALSFSRIDLEGTYVEIGEQRIEAIPLLDSTFTDQEGVEGQLGALGTGAVIGYARVPPVMAAAPEFAAAREAKQHQLLIAVTGGELGRFQLPPGYALINADRYTDPFGLPTLQLPSEAWDALVAADKSGAPVRAVSHIERVETEVFNVTATVQGTDQELAPVVVMTPRSGWWECASERGGGIGLWIELLHELESRPPERTLHFVASTGHELGHVGLDDYLEKRHQLIAGARVWIHLGANFAAAGGNIRLQASDQALWDLAMEAMEKRDVRPTLLTPVEQRPLGEARNIFDGGGSYLSLLGDNPYFHSPADRWPDSLDMTKLESLTEAWVEIVRALAEA